MLGGCGAALGEEEGFGTRTVDLAEGVCESAGDVGSRHYEINTKVFLDEEVFEVESNNKPRFASAHGNSRQMHLITRLA